MDAVKKQKALVDLGKALILQKRAFRSSDSTIESCECNLHKLEEFMSTNSIELYNTDVGAAFLASSYCSNGSHRRKAGYQSFVSQLDDCLLLGSYKLYHCRKSVPCTPPQFIETEGSYIQWCKEKGNASSTLKNKRAAFSKFFSFLEAAGCTSLSEIGPSFITKAVLRGYTPEICGYFREVLRYMAQNGLVEYDYSTLIPKQKRSFRLPSTYNRDERKCLEESPDRETPLGKRDYAIILLANRLGIRSGDISGLTFDSVDLCKCTIRFEQTKTGEPYEICLLDDVKTALIDYINNGRPESEDEHIFIMHRSPYTLVSPIAIHGIISKAFRQGGIDTSGKKHGAHSLRASLATDMVNTGESYDQTRKVLGHKDQNAIKHYARLDVERLRLCALIARTPSGYFERFLNGEVLL